TRPSRPRCAVTGGQREDPTRGQLPVAAAGGDGPAWPVCHHRAGPAACRAGHHPVGLTGPPAGLPHPRAAVAAGAGGAVGRPGGAPRRGGRPLRVLAPLSDILECTPAELIATRAANAAARKTGTSDAVAAAVAELPI